MWTLIRGKIACGVCGGGEVPANAGEKQHNNNNIITIAKQCRSGCTRDAVEVSPPSTGATNADITTTELA